MRIKLILFIGLISLTSLSYSQCKSFSIVCEEGVFISGIASKFVLLVSPLEADEKVIFRVNGNILDSNIYKVYNSGVGTYKIDASAEIYKNNIKKETLKQKYAYFVMMPMAYCDGPNSNILYADIEQILSVSIPGISPQSTLLKLEGAKIISNTNGRYTIKPDSGTRSVTAHFSVQLPDGSSRQMGAYKYRVMELDLPSIQLNSSKPNVHLPDSLVLIKDLKTLNFKVSYQILSFNITIIRDNKAQKFELEGNQIPLNLKNIIKTLRSSDVIMISEVLCLINSNKIKSLNPAIYTLE